MLYFSHSLQYICLHIFLLSFYLVVNLGSGGAAAAAIQDAEDGLGVGVDSGCLRPCSQ
jgi:hypothetical protein